MFFSSYLQVLPQPVFDTGALERRSCHEESVDSIFVIFEHLNAQPQANKSDTVFSINNSISLPIIPNDANLIL